MVPSEVITLVRRELDGPLAENSATAGLPYVVSFAAIWAPAVPDAPVHEFVPDRAARGGGRMSKVTVSVNVPVPSVSANVTVCIVPLDPVTPLSSPLAGPGATVRRHL